MPKINQSIETEVFDEHGNMVSKRANKTLSWGTEPSYIKLYLQDILYFSDIPKHHEKILFELLKRACYAGEKEGMQIVLNASVKKRIAAELGIQNIRSINNALSDLVKGKILYRIDTGLYNLNPYFFGKGDWQDIARLRLEINYDEIKGRTFKAVCGYKGQADEANEQISMFEEEQAASTPETDPEEKKECCHLCGTEKTEMKKHDGTVFLGCPNWREHKKGA